MAAASTVDAPTVVADEVCVHYGDVVALAPTSFELAAGTSTALVGPNGSGKTTLLNLIGGLVAPTSGTVRRRPGTRLALVAQQLHAHRWMPLLVEDVVRMGRFAERGLLGRFGPADRAAVAEAMGRVDVGDLRRRTFGELSGGQRQRVLVAQALAADPTLLLLDEPITGLDMASQEQIVRLLDEVTAAGTTVVLSTHHLGEARRVDRVMVLAGCLIAQGSPDDVLRPDVLAEAYGNRLLPTPEGVAVIDDHGHHHDPGIEVRDLVPQHRHDHHAHDHDHHHQAHHARDHHVDGHHAGTPDDAGTPGDAS